MNLCFKFLFYFLFSRSQEEEDDTNQVPDAAVELAAAEVQPGGRDRIQRAGRRPSSPGLTSDLQTD